MIEKEAEKINSAVLKYLIMLVVIISLAGVMFKFVFMNMILNMGKSKNSVKVETPAIVKKVQAKPKANIKEFRIIGNLTNTDKMMERTFWIGVYPGLTIEMMEYVVKIIDEFIQFKEK